MSLEAALAENTAALKEVAELLKISNAGREAAVAKIQEAAAGGEAPASGRRGRAPKNADAATSTETTTAAAPATQTKKAATGDDLRAAAGKFLDIADADLKTKRKAFIKSVMDHFGPGSEPGFVPAVPAEFYGDAIDWLATKTANIDSPISFPSKEEPAEADDDLDIG